MAVIKAQTAAAMLKEAIVLDLGDIGRQAARLQASAEEKAKQIIADAQAQAARLIEQGRNAGFEQGKSQGVAAGVEEGRKRGEAEALRQLSEQLNVISESWVGAAKEWDARCQTIEREANHAILELSLRLAEKIVHRIIESDRTLVVDQVAAALQSVLSPMEATVRINPADRPTLELAMPDLVQEFSHLKAVKLADDVAMSPGGCMVTFGQGQVDATIETQLRRAVELLLPLPPEDPPLPAPDGKNA